MLERFINTPHFRKSHIFKHIIIKCNDEEIIFPDMDYYQNVNIRGPDEVFDSDIQLFGDYLSGIHYNDSKYIIETSMVNMEITECQCTEIITQLMLLYSGIDAFERYGNKNIITDYDWLDDWTLSFDDIHQIQWFKIETLPTIECVNTYVDILSSLSEDIKEELIIVPYENIRICRYYYDGTFEYAITWCEKEFSIDTYYDLMRHLEFVDDSFHDYRFDYDAYLDKLENDYKKIKTVKSVN